MSRSEPDVMPVTIQAAIAARLDELSMSERELLQRASVAGETFEYTTMYPGYAKTGRDEGFKEIADWFETLAKAERSHAGRFKKALETMTLDT